MVADNIGVIAPYREQVSLLRDVVSQNVEVNTVDQYQGRDKEIIFYSGTRSGSVRNDQVSMDENFPLALKIRSQESVFVISTGFILRSFLSSFSTGVQYSQRSPKTDGSHNQSEAQVDYDR